LCSMPSSLLEQASGDRDPRTMQQGRLLSRPLDHEIDAPDLT
jgi:hypothetical protein